MQKALHCANRRAPRALGWFTAGFCLLLYLASGQSHPGNDASANVHQALHLLEHGTLFFTPEDHPRMFVFSVNTPRGKRPLRIRDWDAVSGGVSAREAYEAGIIRTEKPLYYLVPTQHPGQYANTFGVGAGLSALPLVAPVRLFVPDLGARPELLWWLGKITAALCAAGTVLLLYFTARLKVAGHLAALLALAYGLGTCAFSVSSQALWQHGPCGLLTAVGCYFLLAGGSRRHQALSGLGFGLAVLCRPSAVVVVACVGLYLAISDRRRLLWFTLGVLPAALAFAAYGADAFGSFYSFGQLVVGSSVAMAKTGQPDIWQTPLAVGAAGLLLSPSRGLFVYSPLALFALWGVIRAFRDPAWRELRPLAFGALLLLVVAAKRFDWWGGWSFGYRPIVDAAVLLALLSLPVLERLTKSRPLKLSALVLFGYSLLVQGLGAYVYDISGWNGRIVWEVTTPDSAVTHTFDDADAAARYAHEQQGVSRRQVLNIDKPEHRHRLWDWFDSPLVYYLKRPLQARERRERATATFLRNQG